MEIMKILIKKSNQNEIIEDACTADVSEEESESDGYGLCNEAAAKPRD